MYLAMQDAKTWEDIPGWFDFAELYDYAVSVAKRRDVFVEVGAWYGRSTAYLAQAIRASGKEIQLNVVDTWRGSPSEPDMVAEVERNGGSILPIFRSNLRSCGLLHTLTYWEAESVPAAEYFDDGELAFVFLDADHSEDAVAADLQAWWPKLKPGGLFAGHDYNAREHPGLVRAVQTFFGARGIPVTMYVPCWTAWKPEE